jgi:RNA polymerase sigma-70 factor (ECF subfamily)
MANEDLEKLATEIHSSLLSGDPTAPARAAEKLLLPLLDQLRAKHPNLRDDEILTDGAIDTILWYVNNPARYDPGKGALLPFLAMCAHRDVLNTLNRRRRRRAREFPTDPVELSDLSGNLNMGCEEISQENAILGKIDGDRLMKSIAKKLRDPADLKFLNLMVSGERRTKVFAEIIGVENLDSDSQKKEVKRRKDKIMKIIVRFGDKIGRDVADER